MTCSMLLQQHISWEKQQEAIPTGERQPTLHILVLMRPENRLSRQWKMPKPLWRVSIIKLIRFALLLITFIPEAISALLLQVCHKNEKQRNVN